MLFLRKFFKPKNTIDRLTQKSNPEKEGKAEQVRKVESKQRKQQSKTSARCPYCSEVLEKKPARKKICPSCSKPIFIRKGVLLTQAQTEAIDAQKRLEMFDISIAEFKKTRKALQKKFGSEPSTNDIVWRILNNLISRAKSDANLKMVYFEMALIANAEGKDPKPYQEQAIRQDLLSYKRMNVKKVEIFGMSDNFACEHCKSLAHKVISIDKALQDMPIPGDCTSSEGCRCIFSPADDDLI